MQPVAAFLLAHQDDEFGVFESIAREVQSGARVIVAYLTTGVPAGASSATRNRESLAVLAQFGVGRAQVHFAGQDLGIEDGALYRRLPVAVRWLEAHLQEWGSGATVYLPAWEGGHPDHDGLHAAVVIAATRVGISARLWQFPLYNGFRCPGPFFRVMAPLPANGPPRRLAIPWRRRLRYIRHCMSYPSQAKSWLGLLPFAAVHYLFIGQERLQPVQRSLLLQRPHEGALYYERRGFARWAQVEGAIAACLRPEQNA